MAKKSFKLSEPKVPDGISQADIDSIAKIDYPLFSFRYLTVYSFDKCKDVSFFSSFLSRLQKLSELGWGEIVKSPRHGFGFEKIPRDIIKPALPKIITPDVTLYSFRATGDKHVFVGFREGKVFHIIFVEASFGDVYDHE